MQRGALADKSDAAIRHCRASLSLIAGDGWSYHSPSTRGEYRWQNSMYSASGSEGLIPSPRFTGLSATRSGVAALVYND